MFENKYLKYYKLSNEVIDPFFATEGSAAFDLKAFFDGTAVLGYTVDNQLMLTNIRNDGDTNFLEIKPCYRYKIPTGLIFDIPEGFKMNVNLRGGTAYKKGLILSNSTGIIDWDYVQELFIVVTNTTNSIVIVENGERIAQAYLEKVIPTELVCMQTPPGQKTSRNGGFNSTGVK